MTDNANNDPFGKALGIPPLKTTFNAVTTLMADAQNDSAKVDFNTARANILELISNGNEAMSKLAMIAESSQHPRAFEVLSKMMETMIQANKELLELQTKIREIDSSDVPMNENARTVNNNLFVGSTAELQKMIADIKNGNNS